MQSNYWSSMTSNRLSRRRALQATGAGVLGAAFLAACGGSDDNGSKSSGSTAKKDTSGLLANPTNDSAQRKRGGELRLAQNLVSTATLEQSAGGNGSGSILVHL